MAKEPKNTASAAAGPITLKYVGPKDAESPELGPLVPGRCYQVNNVDLATYWLTQTDHWVLAE